MAVPEATLKDAADNVWGDINSFWQVGTLKERTTDFYELLCVTNTTFPDGQPNNHPVANWLATLSGFVELTEEPAVTRMLLTDFTTIAKMLYRLLWMTKYLRDNGKLTSAQATAVLSAFNGAYTP